MSPPRRLGRRSADSHWPLAVAHRGASAECPENTLAAVRRAIQVGADLVEIDIHQCADGTLVVLHDETLSRTTDVAQVFPERAPWRVADFTYPEILQLSAGQWKSPLHQAEKVPTLADVMQVVAASSAALLIELKAPSKYPGVVGNLARVLRSADSALEERLTVQSFDFASMKALATRCPEVRVGLLGTPAVGNLAALGSWADQIGSHHMTVDQAYVDEVHRHGMQSLVWTVNRPRAIRRCLRLGVDGVISDDPTMVVAASSRVRRAHAG